MYPSPATQRGAAFLAFVALLAAVSLMFVLGQSSWQSRERLNQLPDVRAERVAQAADALRQWYERNAALVDAPGFSVPSGEVLLAAAGVPRQWGLTAAMSSGQLTRGAVRYRVITVWAPTDDDQQVPSFDAATAELELCPDPEIHCGQRAVARVEGYDIHAHRHAATIRQLRTLANAAQAYFHAHWLADPDHSVSVNRFGPCERGTVACLDALGQPHTDAVDAWGGPIEILAGGAAAPPFRLTFQAQAPWGALITIHALQRM